MRNRLFLALTAAVMALPAVAQTYSNPVIRGNFADPTLWRSGDTFYACSTSGDLEPQYPVFKSTDLVNWEQVGNVFNSKPEWTRGAFWAPEMTEKNGTFFIYYTAKKASDGISCIGVATSKNPEGPYEDKGIIVEWGKEAIDSHVFNDNGTSYISWKAYGLDNRPIEILACRISEDGLRLDGEPFTLLKDDDGLLCEGQQLLKMGEWYYVLYAIRDCCSAKSDYAVSVARSRDIRGPYEKFSGNPILEGDGFIQSLGHGTGVFLDNGKFYYLCHAYLRGNDFSLGRQPVLQEIYLGEDGWLHGHDGAVASRALETPFKGTVQNIKDSYSDNFSSGRLNPRWVWSIRGEKPQCAFVNDGMALKGGIFLRPEMLSYSFETCVAGKSSDGGLCLSASVRPVIRLAIRGKKLEFVKYDMRGSHYRSDPAAEGNGRNSSLGNETVLSSIKLPGKALRKGVRMRISVDEGKRVISASYLNGNGWEVAGELPIERTSGFMPGIYCAESSLIKDFSVNWGAEK